MRNLKQVGMAFMIAGALLASGPAHTLAQSVSSFPVAQDAETATPFPTDAPNDTAVPPTANETPVSPEATSAEIDTPTAAATRSLLDAPACSPPPGAGSILRFAVIGDYGEAGTEEGDVAALVAGWSPDLVLTAGDNNYPAGAADTIDANIGQYYHDFICPYTGAYGAGSDSNRFLPSLGNHDWGTANAQPYLDYFELPGNERYYDYVQGPVHFFILDSDPNEPDGIDALSTQAAWLQAGLAASTLPWQIVVMHHPPYSSSSTHGSTTTLQWPFKEWGADAVIAGHDHTYERLNIDGIPYFVNGLGGYPVKYPFGPPLPGSLVRYNADHGAMLVDATETGIAFRFITRGGTTIDSFRMTKATVPLAPANFTFETFVAGLTQPVLATHAGDGSGRVFVVEQPGRVRVVKNEALLGTPFLDIQADVRTGGERGLLALAFHPSYETNGFFYVMYTAPRLNDANGSVLTLKRFTVSGNPDVANAGSGLVLLTVDHPSQSNHNGGTLAFGPDGYLYWSTGDGGGGGDPFENGQDLTKLLGKVLRLDVDSATPYAIPPSNPFYVNGTTQPELIWAYGLRNPWRMSFDRLTGDLYIGDVGQGLWEEIDFQPASSAGGENYGWDQYEGNAVYEGPANPTGKVFPVAVYPHGGDCSVNGGHVYRGSDFPSLTGHYFYGDYCTAKLWDLYYDPGVPGWVTSVVQDLPYSFNMSSWGEDEAGNLYIVLLSSGSLLRMGYDDPLAIQSVRTIPADGSAVCTTPVIGARLLLSDATRTAAGGFDVSKVKFRLDGTDITAASRVRITQSQPANLATLLHTPPSALTLGAHTASLIFDTLIGPVTADWGFTVTSDPCGEGTQELSAPVASAPTTRQTLMAEAPGAEPFASPDEVADPEAATEGERDSALPLTSDAGTVATAPQTPAGSEPTAAVPAPVTAGITIPPMLLPGCLTSGATCPGMIWVKP